MKAENPESCTQKLIDMLDKAQPGQKVVLLRVLSAIGGPKALEAVHGAIDNPSQEVRVAAIRALGTWKTTDAAPYLLALAKSVSEPSDKALCLRGYLGLAAHPGLTAGERLSMCKQAAILIERDDEKKLLLSALGSINSPEALALIMPYLDDPAARAEAGTAYVAIAEKILKKRNSSKLAPKLVESLEKVAQNTTDAKLAERAKALLRQARKSTRNK